MSLLIDGLKRCMGGYRRGIVVVGLLVLVSPAAALAIDSQVVLELPPQGSVQSGIGIVSGWKCAAGEITLRFDDGAPIVAAYGTTREDTVKDCGDSNNAFVLQWNYNLLGDGAHIVRVYDDGIEVALSNFNVTTFGVPFLRGAAGSYNFDGFPFAGDSVGVVWQQSAQRFLISNYTAGAVNMATGLGLKGVASAKSSDRAGVLVAGAVLEVPQAAAVASGIGIVSGWICDAAVVEIVFDGGSPIQAAYGTSRQDTVGDCGDDNNAFVLQWNYALLGDGDHQVAVLADGVEVARAGFRVQTLGVPFLRGVSGMFEVMDFPAAGEHATLQWQQASQSFGMVERGGATACTTATVRVNIGYDALSHPNVSGLAVALGYGASVTMPGTGGDAMVTSRVSNLSGISGGLFQVGDEDSVPAPALNVALVSLAQTIAPGAFFAAQFDCAGSAAPTPADFACEAAASDNFGLEIPSSELICSVSVTTP